MKTTSLVFGIVTILIMCVGLIPCFGIINWINIPLASIGLVIGIIASSEKDGLSKTNATFGIVMCLIAIKIGIIRLILGAGIF